MGYSDPEIAFLTALQINIEAATGLKVYAKNTNDSTYPYVFIESTIAPEHDKINNYYPIDVTFQIVDRDADSLSAILAAKAAIAATINKGSAFTPIGFTMLKNELIGTNRIQREDKGHIYDIQLIRIEYLLQ